jgi:spore photoproduct lyase
MSKQDPHGGGAADKIFHFSDDPLFLRLSEANRRLIRDKTADLRLSRQDIRRLIEIAADFEMWGKASLSGLWDEGGTEMLTGKVKRRRILDRLIELWEKEKSLGPDYLGLRSPQAAGGPFIGGPAPSEAIRHDYVEKEAAILGTCPVAGEKTRCCKLQTLDAVQQCGFACSYCAIQSFYGEGKVYFFKDLEERLDAISQSLDPEKIYHIGTGQSSDSLMWGNREGLLDAVLGFARENPNVILELKSKSALVEPLLKAEVPANVIAGWSLNPDEVIRSEEHLTAGLDARLQSARRAADRGILVGFHLHPIVRYPGWQTGYEALCRRVTQSFAPEEVALVSMGTLTYPKPVIRLIRSQRIRSGVLKMPFEDSAGKLSYPLEIKKELFSRVYGCFPAAWRRQIFFYLCMEDIRLWRPVFGYEYSSNDEFESAMKSAYMEKISRRIGGV